MLLDDQPYPVTQPFVLMGIDDVREFAAYAVARSAENVAGLGVPKDAAFAAKDAAMTATWDDFTHEFIRLCRLEGEYGEVDSQG